MAQYRALVGIDIPPDRRVEAGEVTDAIPAKSVKWLQEQGYIEPATGKGKAAPKSEPDPDGGDE